MYIKSVMKLQGILNAQSIWFVDLAVLSMFHIHNNVNVKTLPFVSDSGWLNHSWL